MVNCQITQKIGFRNNPASLEEARETIEHLLSTKITLERRCDELREWVEQLKEDNKNLKYRLSLPWYKRIFYE